MARAITLATSENLMAESAPLIFTNGGRATKIDTTKRGSRLKRKDFMRAGTTRRNKAAAAVRARRRRARRKAGLIVVPLELGGPELDEAVRARMITDAEANSGDVKIIGAAISAAFRRAAGR
jgi:hypothetical protein